MPLLSAYQSFDASTIDGLCESIESVLGATPVALPGRGAAVSAKASRCALARGELWFCSYGVPITLEFPEGDYVRVQFQRRGTGQTRIGRDIVPVTADQACISRAAAEIDFAADYQQVVWRSPIDAFVNKLAALTGSPVIGELSFGHRFDLGSAQAGSCLDILNCIIRSVDALPPATSRMLLVELEQALTVALLFASAHNQHQLLDRPSVGAAPWQVHRAESYIEANWNKPIRIEDIAAVTGASARSIFRTFKEHRGYSPLEFVKRLRLERAHQMLHADDATATVTGVALDCGFGDLGRFSKEYARAFGEAPSLALRASSRRTFPARPAGSRARQGSQHP